MSNIYSNTNENTNSHNYNNYNETNVESSVNLDAHVLNSMDLNQRPDKHHRTSISVNLDNKEQPSNFMQLWRASVIDSIDFNTQLNAVDRKETNEALNCALYAEDVHRHCLKTQSQFMPDPLYMKQQSDVNEKMRGILVDWLLEVHLKFKLLPETLYLTVNIIDRYLTATDLHRSKLQLVGVTSMLIASKYEEIYPPEIRDFVYVTDKAYTEDEVLDMEVSILDTLGFNLTVPSILKFIDRYVKVLEQDTKAYMTAKYLSELSLLDVKYLKYSYAHLAASCVYLSIKINKMSKIENWREELTKLSGLDESAIRECSKLLCAILKTYGSDNSSLPAVRKKYMLEKFMKVARVQVNNN